MILLSFRRKFTSRLFFSASPQWSIGRHNVQGKHCLFMIHGYENGVEAAEGNFANIEHNLKDFGLLGPGCRFDELVGVLWPGHSALGFWAAEASADKAAELLAAEIADLQAASVSFVAHSLGARVALACLQRTFIPISEVVLLAPAVDSNSLDPDGRYPYARRGNAGRMLVCYSGHDEVLGVWFRRFSGFLNFDDVALGYAGPRHPSECGAGVSVFDGTACVDSHGAWMSCKQMYAKWSEPTW